MELRVPLKQLLEIPHTLSCKIDKDKGLVNTICFYDKLERQFECVYDSAVKEVVLNIPDSYTHTFISVYVNTFG